MEMTADLSSKANKSYREIEREMREMEKIIRQEDADLEREENENPDTVLNEELEAEVASEEEEGPDLTEEQTLKLQKGIQSLSAERRRLWSRRLKAIEDQYRWDPVEPLSKQIDCSREAYLKNLRNNSQNVPCINGDYIANCRPVLDDNGEPVRDIEGKEMVVWGPSTKLSDEEVMATRAENTAEHRVCLCDCCRRARMKAERDAMMAMEPAEKVEKAEKKKKKPPIRFTRHWGIFRPQEDFPPQPPSSSTEG